MRKSDLPSVAAAMAARGAPLRLVIFDCDGVLVDSEAVANRVVAAEVTRLGWAMTPGESQALFLGMSLSEMVPIIVAGLGQELPEGWTDRLAAKLVAVLSQEVAPIPGAEAVLCATAALGLPWRVASNSSPEEMAAKFGRLGMTDLVAGRTHSAREVTLPKPAPDVFLAAAAAEGVPPECCVVVEDSPIGASGAAAAGMICLGYAPHGDGAGLRAAGALLVRNLAELPPLFARAMRRAA